MLTAAHVDDTEFTSKSMRRAKGLTVPAKRTPQHRAQGLRQCNNKDTEGNQDPVKDEPPGGFQREHLYRFSQMFGL